MRGVLASACAQRGGSVSQQSANETLDLIEADELRLEVGLGRRVRKLSWVDAGAQVAWSLLPRERLGRTSSGSVALGLADGGNAILSCRTDTSFNGEARLYNNRYWASINAGGLKALYELTSAIWLNRTFVSQVGEVAELPDWSSAQADIPRGLEHVHGDALRSTKVATTSFAKELPNWLLRDFHRITASGRESAFQTCFIAGVRFLWLHEIGHICLGHIDLLSDKNGDHRILEFNEIHPGEANGRECPNRLTSDQALKRAFEMQADRYALDRLFTTVHSRSRAASQAELVSVFVGVVLITLIFHAKQQFSGKPERAFEHPPAWFRISEIFRAEELAWKNSRAQPQPDMQEESYRKLAKAQLHRSLLELCSIHPFFADWIGGALSDEWQTAVDAIESEALQTLRSLTALQRKHIKAFQIRSDDYHPPDRFG